MFKTKNAVTARTHPQWVCEPVSYISTELNLWMEQDGAALLGDRRQTTERCAFNGHRET